jgi:hypothetical protein
MGRNTVLLRLLVLMLLPPLVLVLHMLLLLLSLLLLLALRVSQRVRRPHTCLCGASLSKRIVAPTPTCINIPLEARGLTLMSL